MLSPFSVFALTKSYLDFFAERDFLEAGATAGLAGRATALPFTVLAAILAGAFTGTVFFAGTTLRGVAFTGADFTGFAGVAFTFAAGAFADFTAFGAVADFAGRPGLPFGADPFTAFFVRRAGRGVPPLASTTLFFKTGEGLKRTVYEAGTEIFSPVRGFIAGR
nr:hypothetical protein [Acetobacter malorum]